MQTSPTGFPLPCEWEISFAQLQDYSSNTKVYCHKWYNFGHNLPIWQVEWWKKVMGPQFHNSQLTTWASCDKIYANCYNFKQCYTIQYFLVRFQFWQIYRWIYYLCIFSVLAKFEGNQRSIAILSINCLNSSFCKFKIIHKS